MLNANQIIMLFTIHAKCLAVTDPFEQWQSNTLHYLRAVKLIAIFNGHYTPTDRGLCFIYHLKKLQLPKQINEWRMPSTG